MKMQRQLSEENNKKPLQELFAFTLPSPKTSDTILNPKRLPVQETSGRLAPISGRISLFSGKNFDFQTLFRTFAAIYQIILS